MDDRYTGSSCCDFYARRSGADKVSIGSDAVDVVEELLRSGKATGGSSIEQISWHYGAQAVVVSIDPRRVYVADPAQCVQQCVKTNIPGELLCMCQHGHRQQRKWRQKVCFGGAHGVAVCNPRRPPGIWRCGSGDLMLSRLQNVGPEGEQYCWWQCTVKGGREGRDIDAITLAEGVERLGAGEIMLNCIDRDGTNSVRFRFLLLPQQPSA